MRRVGKEAGRRGRHIVVCLENNLACSACQRRPSLRSASSMYRCGYTFVGGPCEGRRCRPISHRSFPGRPLCCLEDNLACSACQRRPSLRSASSMYRCGYTFVGGPCEGRRCRPISHRSFPGRPLCCLEDNLACSACQGRPSLRSASSMYRCGYTFVGGPCEGRRCRPISHRSFPGRPLCCLEDNLACSACQGRPSLRSASSMYRCGYTFVGGPCEGRRCRPISRRVSAGRPL